MHTKLIRGKNQKCFILFNLKPEGFVWLDVDSADSTTAGALDLYSTRPDITRVKPYRLQYRVTSYTWPCGVSVRYCTVAHIGPCISDHPVP